MHIVLPPLPPRPAPRPALTPRTQTLDEGLEQHRTDTTRLWISDRQWMGILQTIELGSSDTNTNTDTDTDTDTTASKISAPTTPSDTFTPDFAGGASPATGDRSHARHALSFRCVLRLAPADQPEADHGTYLVHSRNLSDGGLGFVHDAPLQPETRCTVALQPASGKGVILAARVAWCHAIDRLAEDALRYDIGVQFDRPLDTTPFTPAA